MELSEIIKALEDGKSVKIGNFKHYQPEFFKENKHHCIGMIIDDISNNVTFKIIEPNKVVEVYGRNFTPASSFGEPHWSFGKISKNDQCNMDTHKITFEVDKDNKPICSSIKMIEL